MEPKKTPFWLIPTLGILSFLFFEAVYAFIAWAAWSGLVRDPDNVLVAGTSLNFDHGPGAGLLILVIVAIAGLLSAFTTMMLLNLAKKKTET